MSEEKKEKEKSAEPTEELKETGSANLENSRDSHRIKLLTIVGEIEGHEAVSGNTKATKYEHLLPLLAEEYTWRRCGSRTLHCRNDRLTQ